MGCRFLVFSRRNSASILALAVKLQAVALLVVGAGLLFIGVDWLGAVYLALSTHWYGLPAIVEDSLAFWRSGVRSAGSNKPTALSSEIAADRWSADFERAVDYRVNDHAKANGRELSHDRLRGWRCPSPADKGPPVQRLDSLRGMERQRVGELFIAVGDLISLVVANTEAGMGIGEAYPTALSHLQGEAGAELRAALQTGGPDTGSRVAKLNEAAVEYEIPPLSSLASAFAQASAGRSHIPVEHLRHIAAAAVDYGFDLYRYAGPQP